MVKIFLQTNKIIIKKLKIIINEQKTLKLYLKLFSK